MRIRKRWPLPPPITLPPPPPLSSSPPPVKVTPDLPCTRLLDPQSQSLGGDSGDGGLHSLADLSVHVSSKQSSSPPHDSPSPSLQQRPDLQLTIVRGTNGWICAGNGRDLKPERRADSDCSCLHLVPSPPTHLQKSQVGASFVADGEGTVGKQVENKSLAAANNQINENNLGAASSFGISASPSLFHQGGRWCEGEKAFPLKKRRGSFERRLTDDTIMEKEKKMKTKVKRKVAKKWVQEKEEVEDDNDDDDEKHGELQQRGREDGVVNSKGGKKRGSGGLIMEGSRCSRVNGRGWRCCQQTLVGYSLCEHHLGKGRLRSMSSVRNCASTIANNRPKKLEDESDLLSSSSSSSSSSTTNTQCLNKSLDKESVEEDHDDKEEDEKPPLMNTKKRKKIGVVKARSIRSLLGQTLLAPPVTLRPSSNPIGHNMIA